MSEVEGALAIAPERTLGSETIQDCGEPPRGRLAMTTSPAVAAGLDQLAIELPSWAFGNSGTRFKVFAQPGVPRDPVREDPRRCSSARPHRNGAVRGAAHPVGQGRRLRQAGRPRGRSRRADRCHQRQRLPGRRLPARQRRQPRSGGASQGDRPPASSASTSWTRPDRRTSSCGSPTAPTIPDRIRCSTANSASPTRSPRPTSGSATTSGCCSSTSSSNRPSTPRTCLTGAPRSRTASRSASGPRSSSTPDTTRPGRTSSSS